MKILHTSDWHLGRILHGQSLIDEQRHMLEELLLLLKDGYDALLVAGDIYDRALPSVEGTELLSQFLSSVSRLGVTTVIIPGNHDSAARLGFAAPLLEQQNVHLRCDFTRLEEPITISGRDGTKVDVFCLPFVELPLLKEALGEDAHQDTSSAVESVLSRMRQNRTEDVPSVVMAHEFVGEGSITSDSERVFIGGLRVLPAELFADFDYVALGHLHRPQKVAEQDNIRYSGTILPYSFSEANHLKAVITVEFNAADRTPQISETILELKRPMSIVQDDYQRLIEAPEYDAVCDHYISARLTDAGYHLNLFARLKERFPYLLEVRQLPLEEDRSKDQPEASTGNIDSPAELFNEFLSLFGWEDDDRKEAIALFESAAEEHRKREREA